MKNGGLLSYKFNTGGKGKLLFLCERNPLTGHYHYDRGSFVLEANGKVLFPDLGTTNYSNMNAVFMKNREYHSTVYPLNDKMTVISKAGEEAAKMAGHNITEELTLDMLYTLEAKILFADETQNGVHFKANLAPLYSENVVCGTREGNLLVKEEGGILELLDEWEFVGPDSVNANFVCYGEWEIFENSAKAMVDETKVEISFAEESGNELSLEIDNTMTDYADRPVSILRVKTQKGKQAKLISKIKYY
jgi:hypothetical protein